MVVYLVFENVFDQVGVNNYVLYFGIIWHSNTSMLLLLIIDYKTEYLATDYG